ncbi:MAG TPA: PGPGW domain-containing protein [Gordonia sp. (in: high G+C Gram-positive bacteria)]|uniref:PGPGW domain-containing protein n=1 Tax=unclassified Gordonia (in: high G+C Gram-positive bacteria) TaxID=2657482 RepID=UPI000F9A8C22|nr:MULTISPECIES: PGPGW domain-containing protein [unclassified Gordonia (in: high G+C Gram-positive bacteria)]RUP37869.1 MAG: TIGR02611 family protein [Gordonia sp. (in: high G+C Gram-positive bacteria)]HNP57486.1 PGPGW domain-containing protein [Gordonia sp. (in: high G+C Gram-positive bacteria)]HRC51378.1 PGPGW domain-containing protein [Gordonia sp. (in: high G+C Gram-positive bacteria)]
MRLRLKVWHRKQRYAIRQQPAMNSAYRVAVGVVGGLMVLAGMVMIPLPIPGPGWVTFFLGLGVLSTEFAWAHRITTFMRTMLRRAGQLTTRATAYVADHVITPVLLFVASSVYAPRPVPVRVAARI